MDYFTKEYLEYVKKEYGGQQLIQQTNCNGEPKCGHDYVITHGTVDQLLADLEKGIKHELV
jgi:hypothetical protein